MRLSRRVLAAGLAAGAVALGTAVAAGAATNLLANPGFESGTLSGWSCETGTAAVSGQAHSGTYALSGTPAGSSFAQCTQTVVVQPNTPYALSAFVKGSYVYLGVVGGASTWTPGTGSAYAALSLTFTPTASPVTVYLHGWYGQPAYLADDVVLSGAGTPPPTAPPPTTGPPPPPPTTAVYIERALINPSGADPGREIVVLANLATTAQTLTNWRLLDKNARATLVNTTLGPGQSVLITLDGNGVQLGNQGGNLILQDSHNVQVDVVTYTAADASTEDHYVRFRR